LHYLGVGFDRNSTTAGDGFDSPADNAFLEMTDQSNGTNISPGYTLSGDNATVGITGTAGFNLAALTPNKRVPGDWNSTPGCYGFPQLTGRNQFCGSLLMDVGIPEMFLDLAENKRPAGAVVPGHPGDLPSGTETSVLAGTSGNPAMSYDFTYAPGAPEGMAPETVTWINNPKIFVNTGRRVLFGYDYLFDARCGNTGFQALP
jgi:hypothetical protein